MALQLSVERRTHAECMQRAAANQFGTGDAESYIPGADTRACARKIASHRPDNARKDVGAHWRPDLCACLQGLARPALRCRLSLLRVKNARASLGRHSGG